MAKPKNQQPYFPHDANSRNREKIIRLRIDHGAAGYGVYFMLMERLREEPGYELSLDYEVLEFDLREDIELIRSVILDYGLFAVSEDGERFHSIELTAQMDFMEQQRIRKSEAARKGANARWAFKHAQESDQPQEAAAGKDTSATTDVSEKDNPESVLQETAPEEVAEKPSESKIFSETLSMKADTEWCETMEKSFGRTKEETFKLIDMFAEHCKREGVKGHRDLQDAESHFNRWMTKRTNVENRRNGKAAFLSKTAESISRSNVSAEERKRLWEERSAKSQKPCDYILQLGYDPDKVTLVLVMNPEWRKANPPERKPEPVAKIV